MGGRFDSHLRSINFCLDLPIRAIARIHHAAHCDAYLDHPQISSIFLDLHGADSTFLDFSSPSHLLDFFRDPRATILLNLVQPFRTVIDVSQPFNSALSHDFRDSLELFFQNFPYSIRRSSRSPAMTIVPAGKQKLIWKCHYVSYEKVRTNHPE
jgi:hypothetical protein